MSPFCLKKHKESPGEQEAKDKWLYYAKELVQENKQHIKVKRLLSTQIYKVRRRMSTLHEENKKNGYMDWGENPRKKFFNGACRRKSLEKLRLKKVSKICKNNSIISKK